MSDANSQLDQGSVVPTCMPDAWSARVRARIGFLAASEGRPIRYSPPKPGPKNYTIAEHEILVGDARAASAAISLATHGFELLSSPSAFSAFDDEGAVRSAYYRELEYVVSEFLGAKEVVAFSHAMLFSAPNAAIAPQSEGPAFTAHGDYTAEIVPRRLRELLGTARAIEWEQGRVVQLNVWRPIGYRVEEAPLAVCNGSTIKESDLVTAELRHADRTSECSFIKHDAGQEWWYFPFMEPDEVLLIKGHDSHPEGGARLAPHAAFRHDEVPAPRPRMSIAVRLFASLPLPSRVAQFAT